MSDTPASAEVLINFYGRDKSLACVCGSAPSVSYYSWPRGKMKKIKPKRLRLRSLYLSFLLSLSLCLWQRRCFRAAPEKHVLKAPPPPPFGKSQLMDMVDFHLTATPFCINFHKSLFFEQKL